MMTTENMSKFQCIWVTLKLTHKSAQPDSVLRRTWTQAFVMPGLNLGSC